MTHAVNNDNDNDNDDDDEDDDDDDNDDVSAYVRFFFRSFHKQTSGSFTIS